MGKKNVNSGTLKSPEKLLAGLNKIDLDYSNLSLKVAEGIPAVRAVLRSSPEYQIDLLKKIAKQSVPYVIRAKSFCTSGVSVVVNMPRRM